MRGVAELGSKNARSTRGVAELGSESARSTRGVVDLGGEKGRSTCGVADLGGEKGRSTCGVADLGSEKGRSTCGVADLGSENGRSTCGVAVLDVCRSALQMFGGFPDAQGRQRFGVGGQKLANGVGGGAGVFTQGPADGFADEELVFAGKVEAVGEELLRVGVGLEAIL